MVKIMSIVLTVLSLGLTQKKAPPQKTKAAEQKEPHRRRVHLAVELLEPR